MTTRMSCPVIVLTKHLECSVAALASLNAKIFFHTALAQMKSMVDRLNHARPKFKYIAFSHISSPNSTAEALQSAASTHEYDNFPGL